MKFTTTSAVSALLLASTVSAAPVTDAQRAVAERRAARRAARAAQPFPLAVYALSLSWTRGSQRRLTICDQKLHQLW